MANCGRIGEVQGRTHLKCGFRERLMHTEDVALFSVRVIAE